MKIVNVDIFLRSFFIIGRSGVSRVFCRWGNNIMCVSKKGLIEMDYRWEGSKLRGRLRKVKS